MKIGIIGAGHIGSTLAHAFVAAGHDVAIANSRGPATLQDLQAQLGGHGRATTAQEAARFGDVVVVAVPFGRYQDLPTDGLAGKTVIDTGNYYPDRDGHRADLDEGRTTSSELVQQHLDGARVVKAFNAIRWDSLRDLGRDPGSPDRLGVPVSGDDPGAKAQAGRLVDEIGFEPVDAGSLAEGGRKHQPGTDVYTADLPADALRERVGV